MLESAVEWVQARTLACASVAREYDFGARDFLLVCIALYFLYTLIYGLLLCPTRHIPGPFITRFTSIPYYILVFGGQGGEKVLALHQKYGPVIRLAPDSLDISSPDAAQEIWAGANGKLPWSKPADLSKMMRGGQRVDNILSTCHIRDALRIRRMVGTPFARKFLLDQEDIFKQCTKNMIAKLETVNARDGKVDVALEFMNYSCDLLTEFAYGGYFKAAEIRPGVTQIQLITQVPVGNAFSGRFPWLFKLFTKLPWKAFHWSRSRDEFQKICDISIREYQASVKPGSRRDSMSTLIASRDDDGSTLSHEELVGLASILLVAGVDTTAIALTYLSYELAKHPEYFSRLAQELEQYKTVDDLQSSELEKLPLLNGAIRETLRLYPPVPGPLATRCCPPEGTTLGGHFIPGGVKVSRAPWTICRDPTLFPNPDSFMPERWLKLTREDDNKYWEQTMIFSYGPRVCLGKEMALMELRILVAALIMKYTWTGVPLKPGKWDEEMKPFDSTVLHPSSGKCFLRIQHRT